MELIGSFDFRLTYHPGRKLLQADALTCIYVQILQYDGPLDPDWPMHYALITNDIHPNDVLNKTLKNWSRIKVRSGWTREPYASRQ